MRKYLPKIKIEKRKYCFWAVICVALAAIVVSFFNFPQFSYAYTPVEASIVDGPVWVREAPVDGKPLASVTAGTAVTVIEEASGKDGNVWYQIQLTVDGKSLTGYTRSDFVSLAGTSEEDAAYLQALKDAGFPESYGMKLLALHKKYPNWQFLAVQTGLDWEASVVAESATGKNLVESAVNDSRKATGEDAYNWSTNKWYGFDGDGWVCASKEYIAYCMDPRNFLDETYIFQFETLEYEAYQDITGVNNVLKGTFMEGDYNDTDGQKRNYAQTFLEVGTSLSVSPYHLASRCKQEQGKKGSSPLITGLYNNYEGYYNFFNVGAYTTSTASATVNGLLTAKNNGWDSIYKSISGGSAVVANNYVKKGQNTIYFEKFNVVYEKSLYSHQYMTNLMAAISEGSSMGKAYENKNQAFVFRIPIYNNMPENAVTFTDKGNPNNWLKSLEVEGASLTPSFKPETTAYTLVLGEETANIKVNAAAVAGKSTLAGTGDYALNYGENKIEVVCTSQSGEARTYTITVARGESGAGENNGTEPNEGDAAVSNGNDAAIMYGDINGDGKISNADLVLMQKHILNIEPLTGNALEAANVSHDGGITNKDLVILQKHILNIEPISQ